MMSLNRSGRLLQQCRSLTAAASAALRRQRGGGGALSLHPLQLHNDSSQSKRAVSAASDQHYASFAYRSHPSAPVTVGWVNLEQQQHLLQHHLQQTQQQSQKSRRTQRPPSAVSARDSPNESDDGELFYGLPLRVDEPCEPITAASPPSPAESDATTPPEERKAMNRNARRPKSANRGKRPVSRIARREKKRSIGNHRR